MPPDCSLIATSMNSFFNPSASAMKLGPRPNLLRSQPVNELDLVEFTVSAIDPDGDQLTYSVDNRPVNSEFDTATDTFSYAPSKAAIHQMTRNLAATLAEDHIRVNAIAPGRFHTQMTEYAKLDTAAYEAELGFIPLHRWGEESDITGVALLLAARAGAFITGQIIPVDGGTSVVR